MNNMANLELEDEEMEFSNPQQQQQDAKPEAPNGHHRLHDLGFALNSGVDPSSIFYLQPSAEVSGTRSSNEDIYAGAPVVKRFAKGQHLQAIKRKHGDSSLATNPEDKTAKRQHRQASCQQNIERAQFYQHSILSLNHDSTHICLPAFASSTPAHRQPRSSTKSRISTVIVHPIGSDITFQSNSDKTDDAEVFMDSDMEQEACLTNSISQDSATEFTVSSKTETAANAYLNPKAEYQVFHETTPPTKWEHLGPIPPYSHNDGKQYPCATVHLNFRNIIPAIKKHPLEDSSYRLQSASPSSDVSRNSLATNPQNSLDSEPFAMKPKTRQVRFANPLHNSNSGRFCGSLQSSQSAMDHNIG